MKYCKGIEIPKCNDRPQLWSRCNFSELRIIMPDGRVEWSTKLLSTNDYWAYHGCTNRSTQIDAIRAIIYYDTMRGFNAPQFLGYL